MEQSPQWLKWAVELQALAQAGLYYGHDKYDFENDLRWSLPGGWADVDISVGENTVKEVREEAGLEAATRLVIAIQDRNKHNLPLSAFGICKIFVLCDLIGGSFQPNLETVDSGYFSLDELPPLSTEKVTEDQIRMCFDAYHADHWTTLLD